jgi:hypothetical protein
MSLVQDQLDDELSNYLNRSADGGLDLLAMERSGGASGGGSGALLDFFGTSSQVLDNIRYFLSIFADRKEYRYGMHWKRKNQTRTGTLLQELPVHLLYMKWSKLVTFPAGSWSKIQKRE